MLISMKMMSNGPPFPLKTEVVEDGGAGGNEKEGGGGGFNNSLDDGEVPQFKDEDFDLCGCCKAPFKGTKYFVQMQEAIQQQLERERRLEQMQQEQRNRPAPPPPEPQSQPPPMDTSDNNTENSVVENGEVGNNENGQTETTTAVSEEGQGEGTEKEKGEGGDGEVNEVDTTATVTVEPAVTTTSASNMEDDEGAPRRGQLGAIDFAVGRGKKVKEFYSFNVVTGELLHVTALQALLQVFQLRLSKCSPVLNLQEVNENLAFCETCGTMISQLYKLYQEVSGLMKEGSIVGQLLEYENGLTDNHEADFSNPRKSRRSSGRNGEEEMVDQGYGGSSWDPSGDTTRDQDDSTWNADDYDMSANNDDMSYEQNGEEQEEINVKPNVRGKGRGGIKITSVASAKSWLDEDDDQAQTEGGSRKRRRGAGKVDYKKVLDGPRIDGIDDDDDEDWKMETETGGGGRKQQKTTARKKTGAPTPPPSKRGRPTKGQASSSKGKKSVTFKTPPEKGPKESTCQLCHKVYPSSYLADHMKLVHRVTNSASPGASPSKVAIPQPQPQPCLICGKYFENSYKTIKHLLTHVPEKSYGCSRCHETFKTPDDRNAHTNNHVDFHKPMECPKCPSSFESLILLNKHEAQKHRQTKSFLCSICAKLLSGKDEWIQHILSHGPFQCYYCKLFFKPSEYKRHLQNVHGGANKSKLASAAGPIAEVTLD